MQDYAELAAYSNFTFLKGASHPEELVHSAAQLGYRALALTDEASLAGVVRAHVAAKTTSELRLLFGATFRLGAVDVRLIAQNRQGYGQLCALVSHTRRQAQKGQYRVTVDDLLTQPLSDCLVIAQLQTPADARLHAHRSLTDAERETGSVSALNTIRLGDWRDQFGDRLSLGVRRLRQGFDEYEHAEVGRLATTYAIERVALGDVWFHQRSRQALADVLAAIRLGVPIEQAGFALHQNAERHLRSLTELKRLYPVEWLQRSVTCAERCDFSLDCLRYEYPDDLVPNGHNLRSWLRLRVEQGLAQRYPQAVPETVRTLVEKELALIAELEFEAYFLTVDDVVVFAKTRGILCQGRGSAANSAVCYALGITEVDPSRMQVLFERFLSKERAEPPDIDVDFEHERREEVIQYLYQRYGRERAALAATVICYRPRSALRDVGQVFGLKHQQIERLSKNLSGWRGEALDAATWQSIEVKPVSARLKQVIELAGELLSFPRHLSQHVGGFVIARHRLSEWVPIENAAMVERTVIQWDKDDLDSLGLLKVDVLGLGMLSAIRKALGFVSEQIGREFTFADVPAEDPATYQMMQRADTVGVFQIESRAQMAMLPRLKPRCFYDVVIEVALVRPGPVQGGMVHPYLRRRQGLEAIEYPSPGVKRVLERTLGVPIFQEQVMQLAMVAAGFSGGEADQLRRAMAAWKKKGGLEAWRERWMTGLQARGYSAEFQEASFRQILGFGEYGFPESHAASFALLVYVSAWLKCHHPAAFTAALLNSQPMGFYSPQQLIADAQTHGVTVLPVDVLHSEIASTLVGSPAAIRLGLQHIQGAQSSMLTRLVQAREAQPQRGFSDVAELAQRAQLSRAELLLLAGAGALAGLHGNRHQVAWTVQGIEPTVPLWPLATLADESAALLSAPTEGQDVVRDYRTTGLSLRRHPLAILRERVISPQLWRNAEFKHNSHDKSRIGIIGLVLVRQRPPTAKGVMFVTLEDETGSANVVVWPQAVERWRTPLREALLLEVWGSVQRVGEVVHLILDKAIDRTAWLGEPLTAKG